MNESKSKRHARESEVFLAARQLSGEDRSSYLDEACAGDEALRRAVEMLLKHAETSPGFLESPLAVERAAASLIESLDPLRSLPERIGRYRILGLLGEGGMGVVYRAEQDQPRRLVALKVLRPGLISPHMLKRFEHEAQILARLRHPGIAHVYDVGMHEEESKGSRQEGIKASRDRDAEPLDALIPRSLDARSVPYFAMELIEGPTLLEYVQSRNPGTRERLELLTRICEAVEHAHRMGVIHRDLKPSNILIVDDPLSDDGADGTSRKDTIPQPKILDFGVARITDADVQVTTVQTDVGQLIGTLAYMSPEQVSADPSMLDTRSDVYALGVIAYELLAGRPPLDLSGKVIHEAVRSIREDDPAPLSTVHRVFRGDLETIVGKAMEKEKERRYGSAAALADDVRRYLRDEPITARPPSAIYQFRKFARRHKTLVGATAAIMLVLILGIAGTSYGLWQSRQNLAVAHGEAAKARAVSEFLQTMLMSVDPQHDGLTVQVRDVLDQAARDLDSGLVEFDDVRATIHHTIGMTYHGLGLAGLAEHHVATALEWHERRRGRRDPETLRLRSDYAQILSTLGRFREAEEMLRDVVTIQSSMPDMQRDALIASERLAAVLQELGDLDEAEHLHRATLERKRALLGERHADTVRTIGQLGALLTTRGAYDESHELLESAVEISRELFGLEHPGTLAEISNLAALLHEMGRPNEALALLQQVQSTFHESLGPEHVRTLTLEDNLAILLNNLGRRDEALELYQSVIDRRSRALGPDHPATWTSVSNMAVTYLQIGRHAEAETLFRQAVAGIGEHRGVHHDHYLTARDGLVQTLVTQGKLDEAEEMAGENVALCIEAYGPDHYKSMIAASTLGLLHLQRGRGEEAEQVYADLLQREARLAGSESMNYGTYLANLASAIRMQGRYEESLELTDRLIELRRELLGPDHLDSILAVYFGGLDRSEIGRFEEAVEYMEEAFDLLTRAGHVGVHRNIFQISYARALLQVERHEDAEAALLEAVPALESAFGPTHAYTVRAIQRMAEVYERMGRDEDAESWRRRVAE